MAFVHVEASALLVREERLDLKAPPVEADRLLCKLEVGDQRHAGFMALLVPKDYLHRAVPLRGDGGPLQHRVALPREAAKPANRENLPSAVINRSASRRWQRQMLRKSNVRVDTLLQTSTSSLDRGAGHLGDRAGNWSLAVNRLESGAASE